MKINEEPIKILNLYAGIGGNRKLWNTLNIPIEVTAVENNPEIAKIYQDFFPDDKVIVTDAHQYLLEHFKEFDFIWSSPPCPSHSRIRYMASISGDGKNNHPSFNPIFPDMKLYEEILLLTYYFKGKWVVENVKSFYEPLIKPKEVGNHYWWSNFVITNIKTNSRCHNGSIEEKQKRKGFDVSSYKLKTIRKDTLLRNCVEPELGIHIFKMAFKDQQKTL